MARSLGGRKGVCSSRRTQCIGDFSLAGLFILVRSKGRNLNPQAVDPVGNEKFESKKKAVNFA